MRVSDVSSHALISCVAAAMLAACGGGSQTSPVVPDRTVVPHRVVPAPVYKTLYFFAGTGNGSFAQARLLNVNGTLYGTTHSGGLSGFGTVFSLSTSGTENVLYSFVGGTADGAYPVTGLTNVNGTLYGTTTSGGSSNDGTVYSISTSGAEAVLHSFAGGSDGGGPQGDLLNVGGTLYGTTTFGGTGSGTVFSITSSGTENVLYSFAGGSDGAAPLAGLTEVRGALYGTTYAGGSAKCPKDGCGTVYRVTTTGTEDVLYRFVAGSDGNHPQSSLLNVNGSLYGTTSRGGGGNCHGPLGCGTIYRVSLTGKEKVIYPFGGSAQDDGAIPEAGVINVRGTLYGTTYAGGQTRCGYPNGCGTLYSVTPAGSEKVLHSFTRLSNDGGKPVANLIDANGAMYGTTEAGGKRDSKCGHGCGTVFTFTP